MRSGGCTVQQTLTADAAAIVKQAISLARRRGHAQVTPLHVANTMLSSSTGLLRAACLQSHSHPLQCKALELCFNVALNRLPASSPILSSHHHHHHPPFLSNALVAAFKRAQAHQRRGFIETQQQPLLAVKIELEQLVISILDDPSVSRVMREAGFSSTQVKSNVENPQSQTLAVESSSRNPSPDDTPKVIIPPTSDGDVRAVIDCLTSGRKRSVVVVGECLGTIEGVVRGVMETEMQFIILPLHSFRVMSREEVDFKVGELRCLVKSCCAVGRGAVLYLGDLQWASEYRMGGTGERGRGGYCPVEHVIMEIRSLVCGMMGTEEGEGRFWLMGIATYHTYMRCKIGDPSLEAAWGLQPLTVPAGSLELSLNCDSDSQMKSGSKQIGAWSNLMELDSVGNQLSCCSDCSIKFQEELRRLPNISSSNHDSITSSLPSWLQNCEEDSKRKTCDSQERIQHLCKKWNTICHSSHQNQAYASDMTLHFSSTSPSSSSISTNNQYNSSLHQTHQAWPIPSGTRHPWTKHQIWMSKTSSEGFEPSSRIHLQNHKGQMLPCTNPNPNSTFSSHDSMEMGNSDKFKELNAENLKILCNSLEREVPWQRDIIPEIASTILQCRSGMVRRKETSRLAAKKEEAWLFFLGGDVDGKEKIARKLASLVFGSHSSFISIGLSTFSSTSSTDELRNKRSRSESTNSYLERFTDAVVGDPHSVILLEDIEQVDSYSLIGIKNAIETGRIRSPNGKEHSICDDIVILSCESFDARSRASSPSIKHKSDSEDVKDEDTEINSRIYLDLNLSAGGDDDMELDALGLLESVDGALPSFSECQRFCNSCHLC